MPIATIQNAPTRVLAPCDMTVIDRPKQNVYKTILIQVSPLLKAIFYYSILLKNIILQFLV